MLRAHLDELPQGRLEFRVAQAEKAGMPITQPSSRTSHAPASWRFLLWTLGTFSIILLAGSGVVPARAALMSAADPVFGAGAITYDPETQLEWLDLTFSRGRSYLDVSGEFGAGGDFEGFRHARAEELVELWTHAMIPEIDEGYTAANYAPTAAVCQLVGYTGTSSLQSYGILEDLQGTGRRTLAYCVANPNASEAVASSCCSFLYETGTNPLFGHWLVRSSVTSSTSPEPEQGAWDDASDDRSIGCRVVPNPTRAHSRVEFSVRQATQVRIDIYDAAGRRVSALLDRWVEPGAHAVSWSGTDASGRAVPAGVYRVRMVTALAATTRALIRLPD